jgi:hypothetical protein
MSENLLIDLLVLAVGVMLTFIGYLLSRQVTAFENRVVANELRSIESQKELEEVKREQAECARRLGLLETPGMIYKLGPKKGDSA